MSRFSGSAPITALFGAIVGVALWQTLQLGPVARFVPLAVCVPTLALIVLQLALDLFPDVAGRLRALNRDELIGVSGKQRVDFVDRCAGQFRVDRERGCVQGSLPRITWCAVASRRNRTRRS